MRDEAEISKDSRQFLEIIIFLLAGVQCVVLNLLELQRWHTASYQLDNDASKLGLLRTTRHLAYVTSLLQIRSLRIHVKAKHSSSHIVV